MPLSKERNRARMRKIRFKERLLHRSTLKVVQPEPIKRPQVDADGNIIPEY